MIRKIFVVIAVMIFTISTVVKTANNNTKTEIEGTNVVTTNHTTNTPTTLPDIMTTQITTTYKEQPKEKVSTTNNILAAKEETTFVAATTIKTSLGVFKITVYCPSSDGGKWGYATSTGVTSTHLKTCAVDPSVIPLGSKIRVNGLVLDAVDIGSEVKGNVVDIFYDGTRNEALSWISDFGTSHEVFIIE